MSSPRSAHKFAGGIATVLLALHFAAQGATITVQGSGDASATALTPVGSNFTAANLRSAIAGASNGDTINFAPALTSGGPATITLTNGEIAITTGLTITGPGAANLTIDGNNASRIFNVNDGTGTLQTVVLSNVTLTHGNTNGGGAVVNSENLTLQACTISNSAGGSNGGGIHQATAGATLTLQQCTFSGNSCSGSTGGGLSVNGGTLFATNCTFTSNTSTFGGAGLGVQGGATANVRSCTFTGNIGPNGGAIGIFTGTLNLSNSTLYGNSSNSGNGGGGVFCTASSSTVSITNCTISGNTSVSSGGGIKTRASFGSPTSALTLNNVIVTGNTRASVADDVADGAVASSSSNNLIGVNTGLSGITNGTNGNQIGTAGAPLNPLLGALANNGGPTQTMALSAGSLAIDAGSNTAAATLSTDQRGLARINGTVDIGAFEYYAPPTVTSVAPAQGPLVGGTSVTLTGSSFTGAIAVRFGTNPASSFTINSATSITCTAPAGTVGTVDISVTGSGGTSASSAADHFSYLDPATVTSVSVPVSGTYSAGQNLDFTVNFTKPVFVTGSPLLGVTIGSTLRNATYLSGSGTASLHFRYTVVAIDSDSDGIALAASLSLNGGTLDDATASNAVLTLNGVPTLTGVLVSTPPTTIITQPADASIFTGQSITLTVAASGLLPTYQWYQGFSGDTSSPVNGATSPTLATPALNASTNFWVRVTAAAGSIDSATAAISVVTPPIVNGGSGTPILGSMTQFAVNGSTDSATVSWDFGDGTVATGTTVPHRYTFPGKYTVTVTLTNALGQTATQTETVTVQGSPLQLLKGKIALGSQSDSVDLVGVLHLPKGLVLAGQPIAITIGDTRQVITLTGRTGRSGGSFIHLFAVTRAGNKTIEQNARFRLSLSGQLAAALKASSPLDSSGLPSQVALQIQFNGDTVFLLVPATFTTSGGHSTANLGAQ